MNFTRRKQSLRRARREWDAKKADHSHVDATIDGRIAQQLFWTEARLRGFFPSRMDVHAIMESRLSQEEKFFQTTMDDATALLGLLNRKAEAIAEIEDRLVKILVKHGVLITRKDMNNIIQEVRIGKAA